MILIKIVTSSDQPQVVPYDKKHWKLTADYTIEMVTDEGTYKFVLTAGWITDFRSGSSLIDVWVPKRGNREYTASVLVHDACYSGWVSKKVADELLRQGMILSGISKWKANLAYKAVDVFGSSAYNDLDVKQKSPYTLNRIYEDFTLSDN